MRYIMSTMGHLLRHLLKPLQVIIFTLCMPVVSVSGISVSGISVSGISVSGISVSGLSAIALADVLDKHQRLRAEWYRQLTRAQPLDDYRIRSLTHRDRRAYAKHKLKLRGSYCDKADDLHKRAEGEHNPRQRDYLRRTADVYAHACGLQVFVNRDRVIGFELVNDLENFINPQGATPHESKRIFNFRFEERLKQNITLRVSDHVGVSGAMSRDFMESTIVFIPRRVIPHIKYPCDRCTQRQLAVILPTGEELVFDIVTRAIKRGVLRELSMDINPNPRERAFARLKYVGEGIMIRADRRGGSPEMIYRRANNQHERPRDAVITYRGQTCVVPKNLIWANAMSERGSHFFKYATDEEFLSKVIRPHCRWRVSLNSLMR